MASKASWLQIGQQIAISGGGGGGGGRLKGSLATGDGDIEFLRITLNKSKMIEDMNSKCCLPILWYI